MGKRFGSRIRVVVVAIGGVAALAGTLSGFMWMATVTGSNVSAIPLAPRAAAPAPYVGLADVPSILMPRHATQIAARKPAANVSGSDLFTPPVNRRHAKPVQVPVTPTVPATPPATTPTPPVVLPTPVRTQPGLLGGVTKIVGGLLGRLL